MADARQHHSKHASAVMNTHATIKQLLEVVFSVPSVPKLYNENQWDLACTIVNCRVFRLVRVL
jgi:hypothetical protein